jgi:hypothetical protein
MTLVYERSMRNLHALFQELELERDVPSVIRGMSQSSVCHGEYPSHSHSGLGVSQPSHSSVIGTGDGPATSLSERGCPITDRWDIPAIDLPKRGHPIASGWDVPATNFL